MPRASNAKQAWEPGLEIRSHPETGELQLRELTITLHPSSDPPAEIRSSGWKRWSLLVVPFFAVPGIATLFYFQGESAQYVAAITVLLSLPWLVWRRNTARSSPSIDESTVRPLPDRDKEYRFTLGESELIQVSDEQERSFALADMLSEEWHGGELVFRFGNEVICIPAGSAPQAEVEAFAQTVRDHAGLCRK